MNKLLKLSALAVLAVVGAFAVATFNPSVAIAQEADEQTEETTQATDTEVAPEEEQNEEANNESYTFTAQPGDSYTKIARKAVQIYGIDNSVNLSQAQIVAAETFLTSDAGFPALMAGQEVNLAQSAVRAAVEKAQGLDEAAVARWEKFVPFVDFNTDNVGEAR